MVNIKTDRLLIRDLITNDLNVIHELNSLPETDRFNTLGIPETIETTERIVAEYLKEQAIIPRTIYVFGIEKPDINQFIGLIALNLGKQKFQRAEVWYNIHRNHWNKGYATESLKSILNFGFIDLGLHRIEAGCAVKNLASARVLKKSGMTREGIKRKSLPIRGEWLDSYFYSVLKEEFEK